MQFVPFIFLYKSNLGKVDIWKNNLDHFNIFLDHEDFTVERKDINSNYH